MIFEGQPETFHPNDMLGTFSNDQPFIEIEVGGVGGVKKHFAALIDSGFNGFLQIPFAEALPLGLVLSGSRQRLLADGSVSSHLVCNGNVCVDGERIETAIDVSSADIILLGTKLLKELKKTFVLDCAWGIVEIIDGSKNVL